MEMTQENQGDIFLANRRYLREKLNLQVRCSRYTVLSGPEGLTCVQRDGVSPATDFNGEPREVPHSMSTFIARINARRTLKGLPPISLGSRDVTMCEIFDVSNAESPTLVVSAETVRNPQDLPNGRVGRKTAFLKATSLLDETLRKEVRTHPPFKLQT